MYAYNWLFGDRATTQIGFEKRYMERGSALASQAESSAKRPPGSTGAAINCATAALVTYFGIHSRAVIEIMLRRLKDWRRVAT